MKEIKIRVAAVITKGERLLLVQHTKNNRSYWLLPGGGLEFGEDLKACVVREVVEETGLQVEIGELLFVHESISPDGNRHILNLYFRGKVVGGRLRVEKGGIVTDVKFFPITQLKDLLLYPNIKGELEGVGRGHSAGAKYLGNLWE
jgi:ADP-ribose pyrophosphatase YjhB (NUDIX family)